MRVEVYRLQNFKVYCGIYLPSFSFVFNVKKRTRTSSPHHIVRLCHHEIVIMDRLRAFGSGLLFACLIFAAGCGGSGKYGVSGTVKYQGQPVKAGSVSFIPEGANSPIGGAPIVNGAYEIPAAIGLPQGQYKVTISSTDAQDVKQGEAPGESGPTPKELLPEKYNSNTELKAEVKATPKNVIDYDLK
jgi:hypothetical protein